MFKFADLTLINTPRAKFYVLGEYVLNSNGDRVYDNIESLGGGFDNVKNIIEERGLIFTGLPSLSVSLTLDAQRKLIDNNLRLHDKFTTLDNLMNGRIYKNLHLNCFSIQQFGLVTAYTTTNIIKHAKVKINEGGRKRAIKTGVRNVHAFLEGMIAHYSGSDRIDLSEWQQIKYDPKIGFTVNGEVRHFFNAVLLRCDKAYSNDNYVWFI